MSSMTSKRRPIAILKVFVVVVCVALFTASQPAAVAQKEGTQPTGTPKSRVKAVGTINSITGNTITVTTDTGAEVNVVIQPSTRLVRKRSRSNRPEERISNPDARFASRRPASSLRDCFGGWQICFGGHSDCHEEGRHRREAGAGSRGVAEAWCWGRGEVGGCRNRNHQDIHRRVS